MHSVISQRITNATLTKLVYNNHVPLAFSKGSVIALPVSLPVPTTTANAPSAL